MAITMEIDMNIDHQNMDIEQFTLAISNELLATEVSQLPAAIETVLSLYLPYFSVQRMSIFRLTTEELFEDAITVAAEGYPQATLPQQGISSPHLENIKKGEIIQTAEGIATLMDEPEIELLQMHGVLSHIAVPFRIHGQIWGGIAASRYQPPAQWQATTINAIRQLGQLLAATYERYGYWQKLQLKNQQLKLLSQRLMESQENERRRLSRELHDNFSQRMAVLSIATAGLAKSSEDPKTAQQIHTDIQHLAQDMQALSRSLHPAILEDLGLAAALNSECRRIAKITDVHIQTLFASIPRLDKNLATNLYRILQETLNNISKHANASEVLVELQIQGENLIFQIRDDGIGCDLNQQRNGGSIGLISMQERIQQFDGTLTLESELDAGFLVDINIPNFQRYLRQ